MEPPKNNSFDPSSILPPEFELEELLGEGGNGLVYKAQNKILSSHVAIKFIKSDAAEIQSANSASLLRELKACSKLDHPGIVKLLQLGIGKDSTPFLVYEYLQGQTLQSYLDSHSVVPKHVLSCVFEQVCDALSYAHAQGVVHRDIKPSNIMILSKSASSMVQVKILDFGLARIIDNENVQRDDEAAEKKSEPQNLTNTKIMTGSPLYMSPEQCSGGKIDARTDIYSFASVVYQCLLGETVFAGETGLQVLYAKMNQEAPLPNHKLNPKLNQLLMKALSREPENRPNDIKAFGESLQEAMKGWNNAEPESSKKKTAIYSTLLLFCVLAFVLTFNQPNHKNNSLPLKRSTHKIKGIYAGKSFISLSSELEQCITEYESSRFKNQAKSAEICINRLNSLMPNLRQYKNLHFIALDQKGDCELIIGKPEQAWNSFSECLKVATLDNGETAWEAGKSNAMLAILSLGKHKQDDAEKYATNSINLILTREKGNQAPSSLSLPTYYKCMTRSSVRSGMYQILANAAMSRNEEGKALKFVNLSMESMDFPWSATILKRPFIAKADLLVQQGKSNDAIKTIENGLLEIQNKLEKENTDGPFSNAINAVSATDCRDELEGYFAGIDWLAKKVHRNEIEAKYQNLLKIAERENVKQSIWFKTIENNAQKLIGYKKETKE